jgi:hypothetical protein
MRFKPGQKSRPLTQSSAIKLLNGYGDAVACFSRKDATNPCNLGGCRELSLTSDGGANVLSLAQGKCHNTKYSHSRLIACLNGYVWILFVNWLVTLNPRLREWSG